MVTGRDWAVFACIVGVAVLGMLCLAWWLPPGVKTPLFHGAAPEPLYPWWELLL